MNGHSLFPKAWRSKIREYRFKVRGAKFKTDPRDIYLIRTVVGTEQVATGSGRGRYKYDI